MPIEPSMPTTTPVRVWDLPTRLFHWLLVICIVGSVVSAKLGGNAMEWHLRFGLMVFTLLAFRLLWGFVGGRWSRFASFLHAPSTLLRHLRGQGRRDEWLEVGHSPSGALSVFAMLAILGLQVASGLVADDEISTTGPLIKFVSGATSSLATSWHKHWGQWLIYLLVALHIAAILFYLLKRGNNLTGAMLRGDKALSDDTPASRDSAATRALALVLLLACAALAAWVWRLGA
ncbi:MULTISPECIES: cytochrome b/b6 domain-containing protein [unclassified Rhizobacter]|uniref:cytochrome b/b6 domain-containing protein n=1 Tax=unclassified Rhizobacter TaxID=2640088 RepID=UPI0006F7ACD8|nr:MULTISPECIES: cytochrome b/b6 domain-containing protein [unclassified Rhizobacter]KQU78295.1 cytochrome B [Rhizobacter sp. Root29]KQW16041.1 cytochrome B [Rhizobacter sp. Root1238]KRB25159.1 cytochrome B [Rhizobacter sp. Root16D2]